MAEQLRRKTPEEFLREIEAAEPVPKRGYLKVFLGYASGVGKSYRMLDEARRRRERGQDVVVGAIQPQVPAEVESLSGTAVPLLKIDVLEQVAPHRRRRNRIAVHIDSGYLRDDAFHRHQPVAKVLVNAPCLRRLP